MVLGDDAHRIAELSKDFETLPGEAEFSLDRLIDVGDSTHRDHLRFPTLFGELGAQQFRCAWLHQDAAFKFQSGAETEIFVRWAGEAVGAAVFAAAIGRTPGAKG